MYFSTLLASTAALCGTLVAATPIQARQSDRFYLKTEVANYPSHNDTGSDKNGLYLFSYHTGAGTGIAAGQKTAPTADSSYFYLNGTQLLWNYPKSSIGPWPFNIVSSAYKAFNEITISIAGGNAQEGYSLNQSSLTAPSSYGNGWIACDWVYRSPQIFSLIPGNNGSSIPSSCSLVVLRPEPIV